MPIFFFIVLFLLLLYGILIAYYKSGWDSTPVFDVASLAGGKPAIKISVIIPARNEEYTIVNCLRSLTVQTYPAALIEIIVVNDHSTDRTETVVKNFPAANIQV